jgi:hypothetical protein
VHGSGALIRWLLDNDLVDVPLFAGSSVAARGDGAPDRERHPAHLPVARGSGPPRSRNILEHLHIRACTSSPTLTDRRCFRAALSDTLYARGDPRWLAELLGVQMEPEYRPCLALLCFVKLPARPLVRA